MHIILYLCLLLISGVPSFLYAAPPPISAADATQLDPLLCGQTPEDNEVLEVLLKPFYSEPAREFCSTYIFDRPTATITATSTVTEVSLPDAPPRPVPRLEVTTTTTISLWVIRQFHTQRTFYTNYEPNKPLITTPNQNPAEPTPFFLSEYPASQLSSACSCFLGPLTTDIIETRTTIISIMPTEIETVTVTSSTTTKSTITTTITQEIAIPTLCDPKNYGSYESVTDHRKTNVSNQYQTTKEGCCVACFNAKNCLYWVLGHYDGQSSCHMGLVIEEYKSEDPEEQPDYSSTYVPRPDLCPLGIVPQSFMVHPGAFTGTEAGPCLDLAPVSGGDI